MTSSGGKVITRRRVRARSAPDPTATVTVVITCFNYGHFLPAAVGSALSQEGVQVNIIIVDDASTDDSPNIAERLASQNSSVSVVSHERNRGVVESFNDGAGRATGEFLVRLDADDLLTPGALSRAVDVARSFPSVGLIYGHPLHFSGGVLPRHRSEATNWTIWSGREWLRDRCRTGVNVITSPEVVMRRSVIEEIGYMAPLRHTHDMEYWLRLSAFSDVAYVHGADQAWHREHSDSLSAREVNRTVDLQERAEAFQVLFRGIVGGLTGADELEALARRAIVTEALTASQRELDRGTTEPAVFRPYLDLASDLDPSVRGDPAWAHLFAEAPSVSANPLRRIGSFARRLRGRLESNRSWRSWHRNGVY